MKDFWIKLFLFLIWPIFAAILVVFLTVVFVLFWGFIPFGKIVRDEKGNLKIQC
jgi:hypothetical protein